MKEFEWLSLLDLDIELLTESSRMTQVCSYFQGGHPLNQQKNSVIDS
jgi:hypothetical protein